jgi:beta-N-acetylhexosaminidase
MNVESLTVEDQVGQVMAVGFEGTTITPEICQAVQDWGVGGVVLFARNAESPAQLARLNADLQELARAAGRPGLIICIDQEGGRTSRLYERHGFTEFPSPMALAAAGGPAAAGQVARAMAEEMAALGINMDLAPDLDVNNNLANPVIGTRSFGADPAEVAACGVAFLQGLQSAGLAAVGKHFPGHGDTYIDSHEALAVVPHDRARLEAVEFVPFRAAIGAGVAGIMSTHIAFPAIDPTPGLAATLSARVLTGLLRQELRHTGLVLTDCLEMGALSTSGFPPPAAAIRALAAGADFLLLSHDHAAHRAAYQALLAAVRSGEVPIGRLRAAADAVLACKKRFGILAPAPIDLDAVSDRVGTAEHRDLALSIARRAVTVVRDEAGLLPIGQKASALVVETPQAAGLGRLLGCRSLPVRLRPDSGEIAGACEHVRRGQPIIITTDDAGKHPEQARLVQAVAEAGAQVIVAAVGSPYDLTHLPPVATYLVTYGSNPSLLVALAEVLAGQTAARGRLPVRLKA